jgi:hypothetical protein
MIPMFLDFLYGSYGIEFESDFDLPESVRRLSAATHRCALSALTKQAAVGKVSESRVSLTRVIPFFHRSPRLFFIGEFHVRAGRTILSGRFTVPWCEKVILSIWFGACLLFALFAAGTAFVNGDSNLFLVALGALGICMFGVLSVCFVKWLSRNDVAWLSEKIENALSDGEDRAQRPSRWSLRRRSWRSVGR